MDKSIKTEERQKMTPKRALKIAVFLLLVVILLSFLSTALRLRDENDATGVFNTLYQQGEDNKLDGVFIGSSATYRFFVPTEAYRKHGITIMDFATSAQPYFITKNVVKEAVDAAPDMKVILIDIRTITKDKWNGGEAAIRRVTDSMKWNRNRFSAINTSLDYMDELDYQGYETNKLYYYFPLLLYHNMWVETPVSEMDPRKNYAPYFGYRLTYPGTNVSKIINPYEYGEVTEKTELDDIQNKAFLELVDYCKSIKDKYKIVFVSSPFKIRPDAQARFNYMTDVIEQAGMEVYDFNSGEIKADFPNDYDHYYYERLHMNTLGAEAYTDYLCKLLKKDVDFEDHRGDEKYSDWEEASKNYLKERKKLLAERAKNGSKQAADSE